jgi:hypothetical protein
MKAVNPTAVISLEDKKFPVVFDVNSNETKKGVKMHFIVDDYQDIKKKQELANSLSTALQKAFGNAGIAVDYDERSPYENAISYLIPLQSISTILIKALKGE